jgi:hypothetical protein
MKHSLWIIICAAFLAPLGWSQAGVISGFAVNQYGQPAVGVPVYICSAAGSSGLPCSPVASIFYDYNLLNAAPNPIATDANGNYNVYVPALAFPNVYVVNVVTGYGTPTTQLYSGPNCPLSGCVFTGTVTAPIFNATSYFEVNGVQISSLNLSDSSNLVRLNGSNIFTGTTQTAPVWNATSGFDVNGVPLASTNLSDSANLARLNASNVFTGATNTFAAITGTTINATSGYQVGGVALSASNLSNGVSGTGAVCLASGSLCASGGSVTSVGISSSTATQLTVSGSPVTGSGVITLGLNLTGTEAKVVTAAAAGTATHVAVWDSSGGIGDGGAPPLTAAAVQTNCLTTACAGGSTYSSSGGTYTNGLTVPVQEEVTMTSPQSGTGGDSSVTSTINGATGPANGIWNQCNGVASITFMVPPAETFTVAVNRIDGCGSGAVSVTSWLEVKL